MVNKIEAMLGLAARAGHLVSGEFSTEKAIKNRKAYLVILASDASDNTRKHFSDMCSYRRIPYYIYGFRNDIGHAIGKEMRVSLAVTDSGLAASIQKLMDAGSEEMNEKKEGRG